VAKTRELLEEIFDCYKWQIQTEHITEENRAIPSVQQQLRFDALMYHVFVRSPAYHSHWIEILEPLFSSPRVAAWLSKTKPEREGRITGLITRAARWSVFMFAPPPDSSSSGMAQSYGANPINVQ
jgi:hypothetical protein